MPERLVWKQKLRKETLLVSFDATALTKACTAIDCCSDVQTKLFLALYNVAALEIQVTTILLDTAMSTL